MIAKKGRYSNIPTIARNPTSWEREAYEAGRREAKWRMFVFSMIAVVALILMVQYGFDLLGRFL